MTFSRLKGWCAFGKMYTGSAWLSSARAVKCSVKSGNERNPCVQLLIWTDCRFISEEVEDDVKSSCSLRLGLHAYYNGLDKEMLTRKIKQTSKTFS